ncbi:hypothetical protein DFS34DRAFT_210382 [Phlyctochytrium arcticum]|nr:hypothetical protein DFS34DRAFT_210382 [Phlyctochytrium arcticum]
MSLSSDFPISMADDFLLPLSPGDVPAVDPEDQLLNDMEQKYFSEFLDTFSGGEMTTDLDRLPMPSPLMGEGLGLAVFDDMNRKQQQRYQSSQQQQPQQQTSNIPAASSSNTQIMAPRNVVDNAFAPHSIFSQSAPAHSGNWPVSTNSSHVLSTSDKPMPVMAGPPQPLYINTQSLATSYPPSVLAPHLISSAMDVDVNNSPTSATSDRNSNGARKMSLPTTPSAAAKSRSSSGTSTPSKSTRSSRATPKDAKRRGGRELLTEEEKRTNHIMSEQKRRNLIRTGFRALAELVPGLKGGNMGSSKSVILYNTVGFIQHLEQGNRALGDQLDVLHKRYQQQQQMQHHQQQGLTIDPGMAHGQPHHGQPSHAFSHPPTQADQTSFQPPPPSNPPQQAHLQAPQPQQASQPNPTFPETQTPTSTSTSSPFDTTSQPQTSRAQVVQA